MSGLKLRVIWFFDLISNFRRHLIVAGLAILVASYYLSGPAIMYLFAWIIFLYAIFPVSSWQLDAGKTVTDSSTQLVVTSFNIQWNTDKHNRSLEYVQQSTADIIALQEVTVKTRQFIEGLKSQFPHQLGEGHSHVMLISKYELRLVNYLEWPGKFNHRAIHAVCNLGGQNVHIIAIHLQVTRSWREIKLRDQQINTLCNTVADISEPLIVMGDFNAATGSRVLRLIEKRCDVKGRSSLLNYSPTWPAGVKILGLQLDHFFTNNLLQKIKTSRGPSLDSDHCPITAQIKFNKISS